MLALDGMRDVLLFRALMLGDWLCATPALRALRRSLPHAHLAACGLEHTAELARRLPMIDEFVPFPGHPDLPEKHPLPGELERFLTTMRARNLDLVVQMHGSGAIVNALVAGFGARAAVGFAEPGTEDLLDLSIPWPERGPEIERCLALTDALGGGRDGARLDFPLFASDRHEAARLLGGIQDRYAVIHPGSQLPSRRWHPQRFAAVAEALAAHGIQVVLTGHANEAPLTKSVRAASRQPLIDLCGLTPSLGSLGAIIESALLVVSNDTGVSHIAAALNTPSVIVASGSDVSRWAPLDHELHKVHWHPTACRPCVHVECPTGHECASGVGAAAVIASALGQTGMKADAR